MQRKPEPAAEATSSTKDGKEADASETTEQRAKRLRKEARRRLRVTWKPEAELVQVKVFEKDDDEDEGRDVNMIRDAADDRSEGMMLKRRANEAFDEDDDDAPLRSWRMLTRMDTSRLSEEARSKNYVTRGGLVTFTTEEQKRMAEREQQELMVIYTDPNDIPPTPKSPPLEAAQLDKAARILHLAHEDGALNEVHLRWKELDQLGPYSILGRLNQSGSSSAGLQASGSGQAATAGTTLTTVANNNVAFVRGPAVESEILAILGCNSWRDTRSILIDTAHVPQYTEQEVVLSIQIIEKVTGSLAGKPYPAIAPHDWMINDEERRRTEEERAKAEVEANSLRAAAAASAAASAGSSNGQDWSAYFTPQNQAYAPYLALLQQMSGGPQQVQQQQAALAPPPPPQPPTLAHVAPSSGTPTLSQIPDSQLHSILAAINQPGQAQQSSVGAYELAFPAHTQNSTIQAHTGERERDWERGEGSSNRGESHQHTKDGRRKKTLPPHKPVNKALIGTKPCTFWQQGKCARGDKCTFRHD
ncbi:hypothetical protein CDD81_4684 [Ophiocordyceps australis]|uniref:C3H1-type domain-containing protein n=1 Tax=Ophiocordyceps australis TaxID=1399860 RepID=A0A2C5Y6J8_9HYPO|nr:hypothetical protein CDD81_4684 [Ophiocordyceps australis]